MPRPTEKDLNDIIERKPFWIEHLAGPYVPPFQRCIRCNTVLTCTSGVPEGPVFIQDGVMETDQPDEHVVTCGSFS